MPTPEAHAKLSASGAKRWIACPPSANLEATFPEETSEYAAEGTLAHELAEIKVRGFLAKHTKKTIASKVNKLKKDPLWKDEMLGCTDAYLEHIDGLMLACETAPTVDLEQRVDFSDIVPGGFGTADCIIVSNNRLDVVDYKHGAGVPVSAYENEQLKLYGWGAFRKYMAFTEIHTIGLHIVQPRCGGISSWDIDIMDLSMWTAKIAPIAKMADEGLGEFCPGDHCGFCKVSGTCRARADKVQEAIDDELFEVLPPILTDAQVGQMLIKLEDVSKYKSALEKYAKGQLNAGNPIEGWKLVNGRNSRVWTDQDEAFSAITKAGTDEAMLYQRVPLTVAQIETALGKKEFASVAGDFVKTVPGSPIMARDTDKRPEVNAAQEDFKQFIQPQEA